LRGCLQEVSEGAPDISHARPAYPGQSRRAIIFRLAALFLEGRAHDHWQSAAKMKYQRRFGGGCAATIELDNGETCLISVAQVGVLVRSYKGGFFSRLFSSFFGPILYNEKNSHRVAMTVAALESKYARVPSLKFQNPVLTAFACAVWHCSSGAEVAITLNEPAGHPT